MSVAATSGSVGSWPMSLERFAVNTSCASAIAGPLRVTVRWSGARGSPSGIVSTLIFSVAVAGSPGLEIRQEREARNAGHRRGLDHALFGDRDSQLTWTPKKAKSTSIASSPPSRLAFVYGESPMCRDNRAPRAHLAGPNLTNPEVGSASTTTAGRSLPAPRAQFEREIQARGDRALEEAPSRCQSRRRAWTSSTNFEPRERGLRRRAGENQEERAASSVELRPGFELCRRAAEADPEKDLRPRRRPVKVALVEPSHTRC